MLLQYAARTHPVATTGPIQQPAAVRCGSCRPSGLGGAGDSTVSGCGCGAARAWRAALAALWKLARAQPHPLHMNAVDQMAVDYRYEIGS